MRADRRFSRVKRVQQTHRIGCLPASPGCGGAATLSGMDGGGVTTVAGLDGAARLLGAARRVVVFSGAGISTESGIPDFRSPGGLWTRYDPRQLGFRRYLADPGTRRLAWRLRCELFHLDARPNPAHLACVRLAEAGLPAKLVCEVHGTGRQVVCLDCGERGPMAAAVARMEAGEDDPPCLRCGGILKAATVSFGQPIPPAVWAAAERMTAVCDAFVAVGSSLVVQPA